MKKEDFIFTIKDITEIGILCGLAIVLDTFVKIPIVAGGGSINFAMVPLIFISLHRGWFKGFIAGGLIFGLITCFIDGYGIITYPLDYLIAFGSVAIVGVFRSLIIKDKPTFKNYLFFGISIILAMTIRFFSSLLSGMIIYDFSFLDSALYQITYIGPTFLALLLILLPCLNIFIKIFNRLS